MAAPDIPHPARAPHRPQNSAEFHHDGDDELDDELLLLGLGGSTAGGGEDLAFVLSLNLRVVVVNEFDGAVLDFGTDVRSRSRRSVVLLDDEACRVANGERRSRPIIIVIVEELLY